MRKGFTLVELSIVMIIIGMIVGGILVGKSLITTSKISAQVKQLQQFDIAAANYRSNYKYLPGDGGPNRSWAPDGYLKDTYGGPDKNAGTGPQDVGPEANAFFPMLSTAGMIEGNYAVDPGNNHRMGPGGEFPMAKIAKGGVMVMGGFYPYEYFYVLTTRQDVGPTCPGYCDSYGTLVSGDGGWGDWGTIRPADGLALDSKIDDSDPHSGTVRSVFVYGAPADTNKGTPPIWSNGSGGCQWTDWSNFKYDLDLPESNPGQCILTVLGGAASAK